MSDVSDQWWSGYASAVGAPKHEFALADRLERWSAKVSTALAGTRSRPAQEGQSPPPEPEDWSRDFALDPAAATGHDRKPATPSGPSKLAAKARKKVERQLAWLGDEWHVLHVVERSIDLDYILIGPAGIFTLTIKCLPKATARVTDSRVLVDGQPTDDLRNARRVSQRVQHMLSDACGVPVHVEAVIVFEIFDDLILDESPSDVHVTTCRRLLPWLKALPETVDSSTVELMNDACLSGADSITRRVVAS
jgi:hypothetical protein